jgi:hypothetical protein
LFEIGKIRTEHGTKKQEKYRRIKNDINIATNGTSYDWGHRHHVYLTIMSNSHRCHFPYMIHYTWQVCGRIVLEDIKNTNKVISGVIIRRSLLSRQNTLRQPNGWLV